MVGTWNRREIRRLGGMADERGCDFGRRYRETCGA